MRDRGLPRVQLSRAGSPDGARFLHRSVAVGASHNGKRRDPGGQQAVDCLIDCESRGVEPIADAG